MFFYAREGASACSTSGPVDFGLGCTPCRTLTMISNLASDALVAAAARSKVGVDEAGHDILIPAEPEGGRQPDPLEKLKQRSYPKPPEDPALKRHAVPGSPTPGVPVEGGQVSSVSFKDVIPGGRVETLLDDDSRSIVNRTQPGHPFSDGYVQRQIVVENGKVYLRTFGEGNNISAEMASVNTTLARPAFEESTTRIRAALHPAAPITGGKWPR
jgi:hypothetical protein